MTASSFILRAQGTEEDLLLSVQTALDGSSADGQGPWRYSHTEDGGDGASTHIWFCAFPGSLKVVDDPHMRCRYVLIDLENTSAREAILTTLKQALGQVCCSEIQKLLREDPTSHLYAFEQLALCDSGAFDPASQQLIEKALVDTSADRRKRAAFTAALLKWDALRPALLAAAACETDASTARLLAAAIDLNGLDVGDLKEMPL